MRWLNYKDMKKFGIIFSAVFMTLVMIPITLSSAWIWPSNKTVVVRKK